MVQKDQILIVDDMELNRAILCELFRQEYTVLEAENGQEALEQIHWNQERIAAILLDIVMPVMDGFQLLEQLKEEGILKRIPVILITADTYQGNEVNGLNLGALDVIRKPFDPGIVKKRVLNNIELYSHKNHLEDLVEHQTRKLMETNDFLVDALSTVIEHRSLESGQHVRRIRVYTRALLEQLADMRPDYGLTPKVINTIVSASALHDVGKIAISDTILLKPGRLTAEEFEIMKTHTIRGCEVLRVFRWMEDKNYLRYCYDICRYHHERWDGRGYPDGLKGDEIPIHAQAVAVADVYDALTSPRVYKPALTHEKALSMILGGECGVFSETMRTCLTQAAERFQIIGRTYRDDSEDEEDAVDFLKQIEEGKPAGTEEDEDLVAQGLRRASAAMRRENLEREALIRVIPGGVVKLSTRPELKILTASEGFCRLVDYSQEELRATSLGTGGIGLISQADMSSLKTKIEVQQAEGQDVLAECEFHRRDGEIVYVRIHGTFMEAENGDPMIQAIVLDITEEKRTETRLQALLEKESQS